MDPEDQTTPTPDPRDEELARLREQALKFQPLQSFADALETDPSKIYALQAAMRGDGPPQQQQYQPPPQNAPLTEEQIRELNARALQDPARFMAEVAQQAVRNGLSEFAGSASPYITTTAELFIETYKNSKASNPLYKQILPAFEKELRDINKQTLLSMAEGERRRALELRWASAEAAVYRKAAESGGSKPSNLGSGGSGGSSTPAKKPSVFERDAGVNALTQRLIDQGLLTEADVTASQNEIDEENE